MHSEQINELAAALAKAQKDFKPIKKTKMVSVQMKSGGKFQYAYAPLEEIINATREALAANDLAHSQVLDEGDQGATLQTILFHSSGQWMSSFNTLGNHNDPQQFGGRLTYYRRYALSSLLGISSEDDDDANSATGNKAEIKDKPKAKAPAKPQTNGNGKKVKYGFPSNAAENFWKEAQAQTDNGYNHPTHLLNVIGGWFNFADKDEWNARMSIAVDHVIAKRESEAE